MIAEFTGATVRKGIVSAGQSILLMWKSFFYPADVNRVLGTELSCTQTEDVFRRLGFESF